MKLKVGDKVNYHSIVGGPVTSTGHEITDIYVKPTVDYDLAIITNKSYCVSLDALSLVESKPIKIYLGCPYWHEEELIRDMRFIEVTKRAGELMLQGYIVFSPISHSHPINKFINKKDWEFWKKQDFPFLDWCDEMRFFTLGGWEESTGLKAEMKKAKKLGKKIKMELPEGK